MRLEIELHIAMQMRLGTATVAEENGLLLRESVRSQPSKREWPARLSKMFFMFMLLGAGVILGVVFALHMSRYFTPGKIFPNSVTLCRQPSSTPGPTERHWSRLEDWLVVPSIQHNLSDAELLWSASVRPMRKGMPIRRVPKVAFMFLSRGPLPLLPFWERFFKGNEELYTIYVHAHPGFTLVVPPSSVFYGRQIPSKEARWGDITMCDAERRLLANALLNFENERFILLSETCIPIHAFPIVYNHLIFSRTSFVSAFDDHGPFGRGRYNNNMEPLVRLEQWRKGSQWFEVSRKLAIHIVSDTSYYSKFKEFCKPACYVDEHYLPTMLSIESGLEIANRSVTWVDWSRGGPHPAMFGKGDITEEFIVRVQKRGNCSYNGHFGAICFLFARKFSPNTLEPLLQLGSKVMGI